MATSDGRTRAWTWLLAAAVPLFAAAIVGSGIEWGRLLVRGRIVVIDDGLSTWQGVLALVAAVLGAVAAAAAVTAGRARAAAIVTLCSGLVIMAAAASGLARVATRPSDVADEVLRGAESIPLRGYVVPRIDGVVGPGAWVTFAAGAALALLGLTGLVVPAWRARRRAEPS